MKEHDTRVYGKAVSINQEHVKEFYNRRAALIDKIGWGAISLGAEDPSIPIRVYNYDRDELFPQLEIGADTRVLELGCGMGRWAEIILPHCGYYCGVDFSEDMLKAADQICSKIKDSYDLYHMSVLEAVEKDIAFYGEGFGSVIISGVCIYINDAELKQVFERLSHLCQTASTICIKETAAFTARLTLREFPSEALQSDYNAIYRTPEEYNRLFAPLRDAGFEIKKQGFLPEQMGRKREETNSYCTIFKRLQQ